jgi:hypothetical protein
MRVITPGHDEDLAWERLQTQSMDRLIQGLRRHATHVIIEAPPTSTSADAQALAEVADASIIVVEIPRADREHVGEGMRQLDRMGTAVLGAVVLPVQPGSPAPTAATQPPSRRRDGRRADAGRADAGRADIGRADIGRADGRPDPGRPDPGRPDARRHRRRAVPDPLMDPLADEPTAATAMPGAPPPPGSATMSPSAPPPSQLSSPHLSSSTPSPPPSHSSAPPHRSRQDGRSGLAGYADAAPDPYGDDGGAGRSAAGGGRSAAELFPPETFKTESFEATDRARAADRTQSFDAIDDLVVGPADDAYVDPGRVGDR